jgi:starvation-inducible outer membrane lipoprotein
MKEDTMFRIALTIVAALPLAACVTTPDASPTEFAYCQQMEREMGTDHAHDHAHAKGMGLDPMNVTHARCRELLGMS